MKKILSILMFLTLALSMSTMALAAETGSITLNGVSSEQTYEIYKLLDLESYSTEGTGAYSYKVNSAWTEFFATAEALSYVTIDSAGYVTWKNGVADSAAADFAKAALSYAKANTIPTTKSSKNSGEFKINNTTGVFSDLELGYYLVDSSVGALCGLTTTNPNASINTKNGHPILDKQVQEDSTNQWGANNTADIGQTVYYRVTVNVHAGAQNYVFHDIMSSGLTFKGVTKIEHITDTTTLAANSTTVSTDDYTIYTADTEDTYASPADTCTFEIKFTEDFCSDLKTNDKIIIHYEAMLNREALISGDGNLNEAWLTYGENNSTTHDTTTTYTFGIDIVKTDSQNTLLDGAEFRIYDASTGGNEVAVVLMDDGVTYRRARADETGVPIVVADGVARIVGFDNGTYYLEETAAPEGYNKLTARQAFTIADANLDSVFNNGIFSTGSGVHVVNKTGSMLPETGGIGTTVFYALGGALILAAIVLLVTKKRMSADN